MDKTKLASEVAHLFRISGYKVDISVKINHREIDIRAEETQGFIRKIVLVECADYDRSVGVEKLQEDLIKLRSAKESLKDNAIIMHVSRNGYSPDANGYALENGIAIFSIDDLRYQLINFDSYIESILGENIRATILKEYQPNKISYEGNVKSSKYAMTFLRNWIKGDKKWLTLLGDYGVGKSWTLRMLLYHLCEEYKNNKKEVLLPFFIPLQKFTKAFDFQNLILKTFQIYGLSGVHYTAFEYLMKSGNILFLLDSFDEMAQHLSRDTIRENLNEILHGISSNCRAIMTTRPNYFEGRAERLLIVEHNGSIQWHPLDEETISNQNYLSRTISDKLKLSQFARISDLTIDQRKKLFGIVLGVHSPAYKKLMELVNKFQELGSISNRAVIARLLTTVAETLASDKEVQTIEGYPLVPDDLKYINQAKIFEIVVYNLLYRDRNIGSLSNSDRLRFLRNLASFLQQKKRDIFATPEEINLLVKQLFIDYLRKTDTPEQLLENYYRTCRRHSGLTTEGQFGDTSGQIDFPVDELDNDSRVGFSHNSLREYLVADALVDNIMNDVSYTYIHKVTLSDLVGDFVYWKSEYIKDFTTKLNQKYSNCNDSSLLEIYFNVIYSFIRKDNHKYISLLGKPAKIENLDLSGIDLSCLSLKNAVMANCIMMDTDLRKADLTQTSFSKSILDGVLLDGTVLTDADFTSAEIIAIYVFDKFDTNTTTILKGKQARQWLFSNGAKVFPSDDLNPLMGKPWYEAAREVTRTLEQRIAGTHQDVSLVKGTDKEYRTFASEFVDFLIKNKILTKAIRSNTGPGWVVKVNKQYRELITNFSNQGLIVPELEPFFMKYLPKKLSQNDQPR